MITRYDIDKDYTTIWISGGGQSIGFFVIGAFAFTELNQCHDRVLHLVQSVFLTFGWPEKLTVTIKFAFAIHNLYW